MKSHHFDQLFSTIESILNNPAQKCIKKEEKEYIMQALNGLSTNLNYPSFINRIN
jgi:hypothetical protein